MPATLKPSQLVPVLTATIDGLDPLDDMAQTYGITENSVSTVLKRWEPVLAPFRAVRRDLFTSMWQYAAAENIDAMYEHKARGNLSAGDRRNYMVAAAVASEKALLFAGQPTSIVAGIHEHRLALPDLMAKMQQVSSRLALATRASAIDVPKTHEESATA